ncbi:ACT domain-containing protein [Emcibacter sp. SYSU 3D8]|uniref:glycine cleavage system protein R n=1 Tax=Emcibacter sp. SYSU 3D8 TaxID=3133969 RepID=UPI0031FF4633
MAKSQIAYVSMTGPDRIGLISAVTARLFDLGANLADTNFAVLGTGFEFNAVCDVPADVGLEAIAADLRALPQLDGADVSVAPFTHAAVPAENARITHVIDVVGGDRPGLIARLTEAFQDYDANIVRMSSARLPGSGADADYVTRFEVYIPERAEACLAAIDNSARQLFCSCRWQDA